MTNQFSPFKEQRKLSALRRYRLQTAHFLRIIANLRARINEQSNENAQQEFIIAAQAREISALRQAQLPLQDGLRATSQKVHTFTGDLLSSSATGKRTLKTLPLPSSLSTSIEP